MKRRSARPFAVEIKHSRLNPPSFLDIFGERRAIPKRSQAAVEPRQASLLAFEPQEHAEGVQAFKPAEPQARRVLPALKPIFALSEQEETEVPEKEFQTSVRAKVRRAPRRVSQPAKPVSPELTLQRNAFVPEPTAPPPVQTQSSQAQAFEQSAIRRRGDWRARPERSTLPLGERWKHRLLPRIR